MTPEDMSNIRSIVDKCFDAGYDDAVDKACKYLTENSGLPLHYQEFLDYHEDFIKNFRKAMEGQKYD